MIVVGKQCRNLELDPILLEHEAKKLDVMMQSKRGRSPRARTSSSPMRRQHGYSSLTRQPPTQGSLSPTRQPPTRPTQASLNKQVNRRSSPSPVPLRSSMRK